MCTLLIHDGRNTSVEQEAKSLWQGQNNQQYSKSAVRSFLQLCTRENRKLPFRTAIAFVSRLRLVLCQYFDVSLCVCVLLRLFAFLSFSFSFFFIFFLSMLCGTLWTRIFMYIILQDRVPILVYIVLEDRLYIQHLILKDRQHTRPDSSPEVSGSIEHPRPSCKAYCSLMAACHQLSSPTVEGTSS